MGLADYFAPGEWNFYCDLCGRKRKSGDAMKTWDGFYVCKEHKEARNPQDFVRGVEEDLSIPWSRPNSGFVPSAGALLTEAGGYLLQENGYRILL